MKNTTRMLQGYLKVLQRPVTHIPVKFSLYPRSIDITVYDKQDDIYVWCNHAGAETDTVPYDWSDNPDMVVVNVCDKCGKTENEIGEWG